MVYANVGVNGSRARVGDLRSLDERFAEAVAEATRVISPASADRGAINLMKSETSLDFINAAIAKAKTQKWEADLARHDPQYEKILDELHSLRTRHHVACQAVDRAIRIIRFARNGEWHKILGDVPSDWERRPDRLEDVDYRRQFPDLVTARKAHKLLLDMVIEIETRQAQLEDVVAFDQAPMEFKLEQIVRALGRQVGAQHQRIEILESKLNAFCSKKGRKQ
jgi:hypothetical protein